MLLSEGPWPEQKKANTPVSDLPPAVGLWKSLLASLSLSFHVCKMAIFGTWAGAGSNSITIIKTKKLGGIFNYK